MNIPSYLILIYCVHKQIILNNTMYTISKSILLEFQPFNTIWMLLNFKHSMSIVHLGTIGTIDILKMEANLLNLLMIYFVKYMENKPNLLI